MGLSTIISIAGNWTCRASYQGKVASHIFTVGTLGVQDEDFQTTSIYPNPFNDVFNIKSNNHITKFSVADILRKTLISRTTGAVDIKEINLRALSKGLYFLTLEGNDNQKKNIKLIKE